MPEKSKPPRRIRAMRADDPQAVIAARVEALRLFIPPSGPERLAGLRRMLRQERRAARSGVGYDAGRHAALCRLMLEAGLT